MHSNNTAIRFSIGATGLIAAALVTTALVGCDRSAPAGGAPGGPGGGMEMPPPSVQVVPVVTKDVPVYLDEIGKAAALEAVTITPRIQGQIIERLVEDGADVKKDQVLFKIDPRPTQAALESAQAQAAQAKAALGFANIELERYQAVAGTRAISKSDFDTKKNAVDVAAAQLSAAEAAVRTAELNLEYCTVRSPIDGRAGSRMVDVGNVVKENETALLSIQKLDPIYVDFTVNEQRLPAVRQNMANGTLETQVRLPSQLDQPRVGTLTFLDNNVQQATGTVRLRATVPNADRLFWPGQFVNARLVLRTQKDAALVPSTALQIGQAGNYLLVVKADATAELRPVVLGQEQGEFTVVESGVTAGEQVIVRGHMMVQPGGKVTIASEQGAPGGPPNGGPGGSPPGTPAAPTTQSASAALSSTSTGSHQ